MKLMCTIKDLYSSLKLIYTIKYPYSILKLFYTIKDLYSASNMNFTNMKYTNVGIYSSILQGPILWENNENIPE